MNIFIADDSTVMIDRLTDLVHEVPGVNLIGSAREAPEAGRAILELRPDAVILDLQMRNGSGLEVLEAVKSIHPETIIIVLTNYPYPQYRRKCLAAGADFFLDKSTEFQKIPAILREYLRVPAGNY
jgi:DNA-binding NarL/FixJ family response regulator